MGEEFIVVKIGDKTWRFSIEARDPEIKIETSLEVVSWPSPGEDAVCRLHVKLVGGDLGDAAFTVFRGGSKLGVVRVALGGSGSLELRLSPGVHKFTLIENRTGVEKTVRHVLEHRKPSIDVKVDVPGEVYPGVMAAGVVTVAYREGVYSGLDLAMYVDGEEVWSGRLERGSIARVNVGLGPGTHNLVVRERALGVLHRGEVTIARARPRASASVEQSSIYYPGGGEARVSVSLIPSTAKLAGVRVTRHPPGARVAGGVEYGEGRPYIMLRVEDPPAEPRLPVGLELDIISPDGGHDVVEALVELPVSLDARVEEEWKGQVSRLLEEEQAGNIVELLERARGMLDRCKATLSPFGVDCRIVEDVISNLSGEASEIEAAIKRIEGMIEKGVLQEAASTLMDTIDKCRSHRYKGLESCGRVEEVARRLLEHLAKRSEEEAGQSRYDNVLALTRAGMELCRLNIPGTGASCGVIERLQAEAEEVHKLLEEMIQISVPESSASRLIRGHIMIRYNGNNRYQGVIIDFTPASGFIRVNPQPRVELPPIYPGADFSMDIVIESLVKGRIPIPYRVCYREYCLEKLSYTSVGTPGLAARVVATIDSYRGRGVASLRKMKLDTPRITPLTRELPLSQYTCRGILGEGGFAVALLCNDSQGVNTVVKIPKEYYNRLLSTLENIEEVIEEHKRKLEAEIRAFDREARILKMLNHPNIIELREYNVEPIPYLSFEFCEYGDLGRLVSRVGMLDPDTALNIMIPIADALAHGHSLPKKILHLDVKPSNILINRSLIPKLTDYNIAKVISTVSQIARTMPGYTAGFSPPEQFISGMTSLGPYSDIFAHAATLYYILTGRHPYPLTEWTRDGFRNPPKPKPVNELNRNAPPELAMVLDQALRPQPYERYQDTREYVEALIEAHSHV